MLVFPWHQKPGRGANEKCVYFGVVMRGSTNGTVAAAMDACVQVSDNDTKWSLMRELK